jgi:hypothetical protein
MPRLGCALGPTKPVWLKADGSGPGVVLDVMFLAFRLEKYRVGWDGGTAWHYAHELTLTPMDAIEKPGDEAQTEEAE